MPGTQNTSPTSPNLKTIPEIVVKTIDLREFGKTDYKVLYESLRHFVDIHLYGSVFVYCKNDYYCTTDAGYYTHFWFVQIRGGVCYDPYEMHNYFSLYYNEIVERVREGRIPSEEEVEEKIKEFFLNHTKGIFPRLKIKMFKIYEAERTLWIVLPEGCR